MGTINNLDKRNEEKILEQLLTLLQELSITVRYDRGFFNGGLVRYRDHLYLYLNRKSKIRNKIELILEELKHIHIPEEKIPEALKPFFQFNKQEV